MGDLAVLGSFVADEGNDRLRSWPRRLIAALYGVFADVKRKGLPFRLYAPPNSKASVPFEPVGHPPGGWQAAATLLPACPGLVRKMTGP